MLQHTKSTLLVAAELRLPEPQFSRRATASEKKSSSENECQQAIGICSAQPAMHFTSKLQPFGLDVKL
jgi:hypothetical protein